MVRVPVLAAVNLYQVPVSYTHLIDGMAAHSIKLLQDPVLLSQYKKQAYERAKEFDIEIILPQYEQYYEEIRAKVLAEA